MLTEKGIQTEIQGVNRRLASIESPNPSGALIEALRVLPDEAFSRMKVFAPQAGCANRCRFCSQGAGTSIFFITKKGLTDLFNGIKTVREETSTQDSSSVPLVTGRRVEHRAGVVFPYFDNDIGSYPYLDNYLEGVASLGAKVQISTVGWSRHNEQLQAMHERIANNPKFATSFESIRFSWTPYTHAWTEGAQRSGKFSREELIADLANGLVTYRPVVEKVGTGMHKANVQIRSRPLAVTSDSDLVDTFIDGHHVVQSGPHLLISKEACEIRPPTTAITEIVNRQPQLSQEPSSYMMVTSDQLLQDGTWEEVAKQITNLFKHGGSLNLGDKAKVAEVDLFVWSNEDGPYYAVNPTFQEETGEFFGKQFYSKTNSRKVSGYIESERYPMNEIIRYKEEHGVGVRDVLENATWNDVEEVMTRLENKVSELSNYDRRAADYLACEIIPLFRGYQTALATADYPPSYFFDPNFTIYVGQIANQGRATREFRGLAATPDTPMSPWEDRFFGDTSIAINRNLFWRWAPTPSSSSEIILLTRADVGLKNSEGLKNSITVSQLHPRTYDSVAPDGTQMDTFSIPDVEIKQFTLKESIEQGLLPGIIKQAA